MKVFRVLDPTPCVDLHAYVQSGGGAARLAARVNEPLATVEQLQLSGLRGRGGAGFPTAKKWKSILTNASVERATSVVINGAEGEPSTFKDRTILRNNPYRVLEGALVACAVVGAVELVVCLKQTFHHEWERVTAALVEMTNAGWLDGVRVTLVAGPSSYLFGEETALLEVIEHRQPFPRLTPPWRRGLAEHGQDGPGLGEDESSPVLLATAEPSGGAPALVNNVETFANVALIGQHGADWFREMGTDTSPGTIVCTIVGDVKRHGVAEFAMGTTLRSVITDIGGGPRRGRRLIAALPGASSVLIESDGLDTPLTHEAMRAAGSALGSAGFHCIDDAADTFALAHGASRFLSVESCGQCMPCKEDGIAVTDMLAQLLVGTAMANVEADIASRLASVVKGARCSLASQQQNVIGSLVKLCATSDIVAHLPEVAASDRQRTSVIVPLLDIVDGVALLDESYGSKNFDWSYNQADSGVFPAQLFQDVPMNLEPPLVNVE